MIKLPLNIRTATEAELPACAKILMDELRKQGEEWVMDSAKARLAELRENNPDLCFCLELDGKVIGFSFAETFNYIKGRYLWISEFVIETENQGKGFGLEALRFMEKLGKERGFNILYLATNIEEKAFKIYEKFGFRNTKYCFMEKEL